MLMQASNAFDITAGAEALWEGLRSAISAEDEVALGRRHRVSPTAWRTPALLSPQGGLSVLRGREHVWNHLGARINNGMAFPL